MLRLFGFSWMYAWARASASTQKSRYENDEFVACSWRSLANTYTPQIIHSFTFMRANRLISSETIHTHIWSARATNACLYSKLSMLTLIILEMCYTRCPFNFVSMAFHDGWRLSRIIFFNKYAAVLFMWTCTWQCRFFPAQFLFRSLWHKKIWGYRNEPDHSHGKDSNIERTWHMKVLCFRGHLEDAN